MLLRVFPSLSSYVSLLLRERSEVNGRHVASSRYGPIGGARDESAGCQVDQHNAVQGTG